MCHRAGRLYSRADWRLLPYRGGLLPGVPPRSRIGLCGSSVLSREGGGGCRAEIPLWLKKRMEAYGDDAESQRQLGIEFVTDLCQRLLDAGAPGLHFYALNRAEPTSTIWSNLGLPAAAA